MKRHSGMFALALGLGLMVITGVLLRWIDENRRIGEPGLKMVNETVFDEQGTPVGTNTVALPETVLGYQSTNGPITRVELDFLPADTTYARRFYYATNQPRLQVNVVMMGLDRTSIHKPQLCLTGQGFSILSEVEERIPLESGPVAELPVWKMVAEREQQMVDGSFQPVRAVYVYWFVAEDHVTARHGERMLWSAKELLAEGTLQRWAYVSVLGFCLPGDEDRLYSDLTAFIQASVPQYHLFSDKTVVSGSN